MVDANTKMFERLKEKLPTEYQRIGGAVKRYILTSPSEKNWLQNVSFSTDPDLVFSTQQQVCIATLDAKSYLLCIGFKPDFGSEEFVQQEVNAGLFCAAVVELGLEAVIGEATSYELADKIFYPVDAQQPQKMGYEWETVGKYFPTFNLFQIPPGSPFFALEDIVFRVGIFSLTKTASLRPLLWSSDALEIAREICTTENEHFPISLVLHAMLERKWEHAFLDVYRCIEFLFPFPKANDLKRALKLDSPTIDISYQIESVLGWRQQEDVALNTLFSKLQAEQLTLLSTALGVKAEEAPGVGSLCKTVAKRIYKLRNDCVHYRPAQSKSQLRSMVDWPLLVQELLKAASFFHRSETSPQT
jgi:hypothetical protein